MKSARDFITESKRTSLKYTHDNINASVVAVMGKPTPQDIDFLLSKSRYGLRGFTYKGTTYMFPESDGRTPTIILADIAQGQGWNSDDMHDEFYVNAKTKQIMKYD